MCYVIKPIEDPKGWLDGVNMRSKKGGQFPGTYCELVDNNAAPPRPKVEIFCLKNIKSEIFAHTNLLIFVHLLNFKLSHSEQNQFENSQYRSLTFPQKLFRNIKFKRFCKDKFHVLPQNFSTYLGPISR